MLEKGEYRAIQSLIEYKKTKGEKVAIFGFLKPEMVELLLEDGFEVTQTGTDAAYHVTWEI